MRARIDIWMFIGGLLLAGAMQPTSVWAQRTGELPAIYDGVGLDEHYGDLVPGDLTFFDEDGRAVPIGSYLDGETPVVLNFVYHNCPMLCNMLLEGLTRSLAEMRWTPGQQFTVLTVSFSGIETPDLAARQKDRFLGALGKPEAATGWHFLIGSDENIQALAASVGFQFKWVEEAGQYAHPATLIFLSGEGRISRYLYGMDFPPGDIRKALVEASEGTIGSPVDQLILYCFQYDPVTNTYVASAQNIMKLGGLLTVLFLGGMLWVFWHREQKRHLEPT
jgi:protein SCO1/2